MTPSLLSQRFVTHFGVALLFSLCVTKIDEDQVVSSEPYHFRAKAKQSTATPKTSVEVAQTGYIFRVIGYESRNQKRKMSLKLCLTRSIQRTWIPPRL